MISKEYKCDGCGRKMGEYIYISGAIMGGDIAIQHFLNGIMACNQDCLFQVIRDDIKFRRKDKSFEKDTEGMFF